MKNIVKSKMRQQQHEKYISIDQQEVIRFIKLKKKNMNPE